MSTIVILVVIAVVVYAAYAILKGRPTRTEHPDLHTEPTAGGRSLPSVALDLGKLPKAWETVSGEQLVLKLSESVSITLQGPLNAGQEIERYLVQTRGERFPERAPGLAILMSRLNIEVPEIEAFRKSILTKVERAALSAVAKNRDIGELRTNDPELLNDLLEEREQEAYEELDGRPSHWRDLSELRVPRPSALEGDDALLAKVNHDPNLLWVYSGFAGDQARARRVPDGESIEPWVALVETGLAMRGADIPAENLVTAFTLAELNAALRPEKPIRRKAAARDLLTGEAVNLLPDIRRVFLLKPMDAEARRALEGFEWVRTQAALLVETVASAEQSQVAMLTAPVGTRGAHWSVYGECCARARALQERSDDSGRRPRQLPPFHIGCEARVEVWVE